MQNCLDAAFLLGSYQAHVAVSKVEALQTADKHQRETHRCPKPAYRSPAPGPGRAGEGIGPGGRGVAPGSVALVPDGLPCADRGERGPAPRRDLGRRGGLRQRHRGGRRRHDARSPLRPSRLFPLFDGDEPPHPPRGEDAHRPRPLGRLRPRIPREGHGQAGRSRHRVRAGRGRRAEPHDRRRWAPSGSRLGPFPHLMEASPARGDGLPDDPR